MPLTNTDIFIVLRGGVQYKMTATQLREFVGATSDYNSATKTTLDAGTITDGESNDIATELLNVGDRVFVGDASADPDVDSGWAVYRVMTLAPLVYEKIQEQESLDMVIDATTDLSLARDATSATVQSSSGTNAIIPLADSTNAGLMSPDALSKVHVHAIAAGTNQTNFISVDPVTQAINLDDTNILPLP